MLIIMLYTLLTSASVKLILQWQIANNLKKSINSEGSQFSFSQIQIHTRAQPSMKHMNNSIK